MFKLMFLLGLVGCTVGEVGSPGTGGDDDDDGGGVDAPAGTTARVTVTATTTPTPGGGEYAPRNVVAVWVESSGGAFVKTIQRHAQVRISQLVAWNAKAGAGDVDAVTGATRSDHATPLTISWDMLDRDDAVVADGTYTLRMESSDLNAISEAENNQGTFTFVKGAAPESQTALTSGGFTNVSIDFTP
ncbi:MAG: DUF2271 domain-containing protein [Kofleriaceae bacterium]